jgi:hypothetical protein
MVQAEGTYFCRNARRGSTRRRREIREERAESRGAGTSMLDLAAFTSSSRDASA